MFLLYPVPVLENPKHEAFAQIAATGTAAGEAYRQVYNAKASTCETSGPELLRKSQVAARVAEIQGKAAEKVGWSIEERLEFLKSCAITPPAKVKLDDAICQGERVTKGGSTYLLIPDKIKACVEYSRLAGDLKDKGGDVRVVLPGSMEEALVKLMYGPNGKPPSVQ